MTFLDTAINERRDDEASDTVEIVMIRICLRERD